MALNERQLSLAKALGRFTDSRSKEEIGMSFGYSSKWVYVLQRSKEFMDEVRKEAVKHRSLLLMEADRGLLLNVRKGDVAAIKIAYQLAGELQSGVNVTTNVRQDNAPADKLVDAMDRVRARRDGVLVGADPESEPDAE